MFWVVDSLTMRKLKTAKSLDDSCDVTPVKGDASPWPVDEESRVRTAKRARRGSSFKLKDVKSVMGGRRIIHGTPSLMKIGGLPSVILWEG